MKEINKETNEIFSIGYANSKPQIMEVRKVTQKKSTLTTYAVVANIIGPKLEIVDTTLKLKEIQFIKETFC